MNYLITLITKYLPQIKTVLSKLYELFFTSPERKEELRKQEEIKTKIKDFLKKNNKL